MILVSRTPALIGIFFAFATSMCAFAGATLLAPGGPLDALWAVKAEEHRRLLGLGQAVGIAFLALGLVTAIASYGAFERRRWARPLAIGIFAVNAIGDALRIPAGAVAQGLMGIAVAGVLIWWLSRPDVRRAFNRQRRQPAPIP